VLGSSTPARVGVSRRAVIVGAASAVVLGGSTIAAVESGVIPGRTTMHALLGLNGASGTVPAVTSGRLVTGAFDSAVRQGSTEWAASYPPGATPGDPLPVLISLHGVGGTHKATFGTYLGLDKFQAAASSPFVIASVDGGNSYWHARSSGEDAGQMVIDEFLPLLAAHGLVTDRVGLFGWSMGGFGALDLARSLGPDRVACVIAESPALWTSAGRTPAGAFDDAEDFAAHTPFGRQAELDGIAVRIDCGQGDGFYPTAVEYVGGFATPPVTSFEPGGHNPEYWRRMAPAQLEFAAKHLQ
jgi:pimeloyl-ACP methyl ester carboxylesterase